MEPAAGITCIFGKRGSGKSTLARKLVTPCRRLLVFNTLGEPEHNNLGIRFDDPEEMRSYLEEFRRRDFRAVADFRDDGLFDWTLELAAAIKNVTVFVDELDRFGSPTSISEALDNCCRYGRHDGVSLVVISRRPAEIPRIVTSQACAIYTFKIQEPRDVAYLRQFVGDERFTALPDFSYIEYKL